MTTDVQGLLARLKLWASACITPEQRAFHEAIVCIERQAAELEQFRKDAERYVFICNHVQSLDNVSDPDTLINLCGNCQPCRCICLYFSKASCGVN